jgi:hypothetical protein
MIALLVHRDYRRPSLPSRCPLPDEVSAPSLHPSDIPVATARSHEGQLTERVARGRMRVVEAAGVCEAVGGRGRAGVTVYWCRVCILGRLRLS